MRTLKYAILGLLNQNSMTGYDLALQFESALQEFWSAKHSQIYPELKKLTEEKMVCFEVAITGNVMKKKVYSITKEGKEEFEEWMHQEEKMESTPKDVFRLRLFFSNSLPVEERISFIQYQLAQHQARLNHLKKNQEKFKTIPDRESDEFGDYMVLMGAVMREETNCQWLNRCLELCRR